MSERELPEGWVETTLSELNTHVSRSFDPKKHPDAPCELYSVPVFFDGQPEKVEGKEIGSTKQYVEPGDVLICKINPRINRVWKVGYLKERVQIASSEWIAVRQPNLDARYLKYYFQSQEFRNRLCADVSGVGGSLTRAKPKLIVGYPVPICSLAEQKIVADKLDELLAQVNNLKARLDAIPATLKKFRQSVLASAVSGRLTEEWRQTHNKNQWEFRPLGDHPVEVQIGPFGSLLHKSDYVDGGISLINPMHINDGKVTPSLDMTVTEGKAEELARYSLRKGDVVLGRRGEMGRSAVIQSSQTLLCGTGSLFLRPDLSRVFSDFLSLYLRSPKTVYALESGSAGSTMVNLNQKILKDVPYPDVGIEEQHEIVRRVEQLFAFADQVEQQVANAQARVNKLTQSILAKAFRGELTAEWRAANPELISGENSAEALLERIKAEKAKQKPAGKKA